LYCGECGKRIRTFGLRHYVITAGAIAAFVCVFFMIGLAMNKARHAKELADAEAKADKARRAKERADAEEKEEERNRRLGIEWVSIPGGSFMMGSVGGGYDEKPRHEVTVKAFELAKSEVTVAQYKACVDAGACGEPGTEGYCNWGVQGRENHPVNCVNWEDAWAFSKWVGGRLPSEAEWEYAARSAGKNREYPWGDEAATCQRAVINDGGLGCGKDSTWPVCSKPGGNTEQGLCDMAGNVWEWAQDWYHDSYKGAPNDGSAWESPAGSGRVVRGGSWVSGAGYARAARRDSAVPGYRFVYLGLRPARSP
jgi:formylglycine-generating enzyme required for sulfatase activity